MDAMKSTWQYTTPEYEKDLDYAISNLAAREIKDYCRRTGTALEPKTDAYRKVGIEFIKAKIAAGHPGAELPLPDGQRISGMFYNQPKIEAPVAIEAPAVLAPPKKTAETFSEACERYIATVTGRHERRLHRRLSAQGEAVHRQGRRPTAEQDHRPRGRQFPRSLSPR